MVSENEMTKQTYELWVNQYVDNTINIVTGETKEWIDDVLRYINLDDSILEVGSWAWRDAKYIESLWYTIQRSDWTYAFVEYLQSLWYDCEYVDLMNNSYQKRFNLIFANAVFLHFTDEDLHSIFETIKQNIMPQWFIAFSVKKWIWSEWSEWKMNAPRFFNYWQEKELILFVEWHWWNVLSTTSSHGDKWIRIIAQIQ